MLNQMMGQVPPPEMSIINNFQNIGQHPNSINVNNDPPLSQTLQITLKDIQLTGRDHFLSPPISLFKSNSDLKIV